MRARPLKVFLLLCGILLCVVVYWTASPGEPRYHGRRISVWLENYPRFKQMDWRESEAAIRAVGTNGILYIFGEFRRRDSFTESLRARLWFNGPTWVKRLVGPPKSRFDVSYAPEVFTAIGPASIPPLIAGLGDKNDHVRIAAIKALGEFGPRAKDAIPALTNLLAQAQSRLAADANTNFLAQWPERHLASTIKSSIARIDSESTPKPPSN